MKIVPILASFLFVPVLLEAQYTYEVSRSVPCSNINRGDCTGDITLEGYLTVHTLGALSGTSFSDWKLTFSSTNYAATELNPSNSNINWAGDQNGVASETELTLDVNFCNDRALNIFSISSTQAFPYYVAWKVKSGGLNSFKEDLDHAPRSMSDEPVDLGEIDRGCSGPDIVFSRQLSGGGIGDPHFKKWDNSWYDFHGICDQVLVTSPTFGDGLGLDIHVRTKPRYEYSYIEAAAIKLGDDILQVGSWGQYWINGVESVELPFTMANKYAVDRVVDSKRKHKFVITLDKLKMEVIVINVVKDMVNVNVENATATNFGGSQGMLGSFPGGVELARDGATIVEDHNLFGQEWQVLESDPCLFLSSNPHQPLAGVCVPLVASAEGRRLGEGIEKEAAEKACANHQEPLMKDMCTFDVMAMIDLDVAEIHGAF